VIAAALDNEPESEMNHLPERHDAQLVSATLAGKPEAYQDLVTRYQGHVYGLAYSLVGSWTDAQDIAQETFIRAYLNLDQLRDASRFAAWLRRVTFGVTMNWIKAYRPKVFAELDGRVDLDKLEIADFQPGPAEVAEKRELAEAVMRAVRSLPSKYRVPLTMFHLDGLSYEKVASFLDIPLGTAKSLIHRAQAKLKSALATAAAAEAAPMVQEVFNEHKLAPEFARKVLENVPPLGYDKWDCTFAGAVTSCMQYLGEDVTYDYVMGISGGAFRVLWYPQWCPSIGTLLVLGQEVIERTFNALGYVWDGLWRKGEEGEEEKFRRLITESIDRGRPVVVEGIVGPPEAGLVTGYDQQGDVLLGWSFFHDTRKGYYEKADWYGRDQVDNACHGLILIGAKGEPPPKGEILRRSIEWAVAHARQGTLARHDGAVYVCGLAAYDAWAEALTRDEDFPEGNLSALTFRCLVNANVGICNLHDSRRAAAAFLRQMAGAAGPAADDLLAAAALYEEEAAGMQAATDMAPFSWQPEEKRRKMADPKLRRSLSGLLLAAKEKDALAIERLARALHAMGSSAK
jgi:RNA polymerase sigma factor (sigma-70 family)